MTVIFTLALLCVIAIHLSDHHDDHDYLHNISKMYVYLFLLSLLARSMVWNWWSSRTRCAKVASKNKKAQLTQREHATAVHV